MFVNRFEWTLGFVRIEHIALVHLLGNQRLVQPPQFQRMIHAGGDDAIAGQVEVGAQHFIAMALNTAENCYAHASANVPQTHRMILAGWEQHMRFLWMEFQLVNSVTMTDKVLMARHIRDIKNTYYATFTGRGQHRSIGIFFPAPATRVENFRLLDHTSNRKGKI